MNFSKEQETLQFEINSEVVSWERLDGEVIIISFETGEYFSTLNAGADVISLISKKVDRKLWIQIFSNYFPAETALISDDIESFLEVLLSKNIIKESTLAIQSNYELPKDYLRKTWEKPVINVFDDLKNLLSVDPIHETSLDGWPERPNDLP
jgi:hypothetical protein